MKTKYTLCKNKLTGERSIFVNECPGHQEKIMESAKPEEYARLRKLALRNIARKQKDDCMKDLGLIKVKGNLGGTYYE